jgi:hypothetical protein
MPRIASRKSSGVHQVRRGGRGARRRHARRIDDALAGQRTAQALADLARDGVIAIRRAGSSRG